MFRLLSVGSILFLLALSSEARAHEVWTKEEAERFGVAQTDNWVSGKTNPVTGSSCCGISDCNPVPIDAVEVFKNGYRIRTTDEFVPHEETQPSEDFRHWICRFGRYHPKANQIRCLFIYQGAA